MLRGARSGTSAFICQPVSGSMICTDARCVPRSLSGRETPHLCPDRAAWRPLEELGAPLTPGGGDPQAREPATGPAGGQEPPGVK